MVIGLKASELEHINLRQLGASTNKEGNNTSVLQRAIQLAKKYHLPIYIPKGEYHIKNKRLFKNLRL